uniref:Uncharacterized protein n=2 Tax=unclassified Caudoviricetes TaxID=2788787 RepID=A0AAU8HY80_9CAUD
MELTDAREARLRTLYRCWIGYSIFFTTGKMKFDDDHVPIVRYPNLDDRKARFMTINMEKVLGKIHSDLFPLFFVSLGIKKLGVFPQPFQELGPKEIENLKLGMKQMILHLANLRTEWSSRKEDHFSYESLVEEIGKNKASVPFAVMYAKKHNVESMDFGMTGGLMQMQVGRVLDRCIHLEKEYSFFTKNNVLAVSMANLWKSMGEI